MSKVINDKQDAGGPKAFKITVKGKMTDGRPILPTTLGIHKFAQIFERFQRLVETSLQASDNKKKIEQVTFEYLEGSADFSANNLPLGAHQVIAQEVRQITDGHPASIALADIGKALVDFKKIATDIGSNTKITIGTEDENYIEITKDTVLDQLKETFTVTENIVYGRLYAVGGKDPNIHLSKGDDGTTMIVNLNEGEAKGLANSLYAEVGINISAKQSNLTGELIAAKYIKRIPYSRVLDEEKLKRDIEQGTKVWAGIDPVEYEKEQRGIKV